MISLDLGDLFDTRNVTNMNWLFSYAGYANNNFELDLTGFSFDNVTNYVDMFQNFKTTQKIYVKNTSDQSWILDKGFTNLSTNNVIVRS